MSSATIPATKPKQTPPGQIKPMPATPAAKLKPKEHGAYAILGIPLATALLIAGPTLIGVCVAIAATAGFVAHEPLLVAWGLRGTRAQRNTPAAKQRLAWLLGVSAICGSVALVLGSTAVRVSLLGCLVLAVVGFALALAGKHRSLPGQLWGVVGLSATCLPILFAGGMPLVQVVDIWLVWLLGFSATTLAVRGVIAAQKRKPRSIYLAVFGLLTVVLLGLAVSSHPRVLVAMPMWTMSVYVLAWPPPAKYLWRVGWSSLGCTLATAVVLLVVG